MKGNEYDSSYYIENQVVPSVEKILSVFGYTKDDIMQHREQKSLEGFF